MELAKDAQIILALMVHITKSASHTLVYQTKKLTKMELVPRAQHIQGRKAFAMIFVKAIFVMNDKGY